MNKVFKDILDVYMVIVYLHDIMIYSDNPDQHLGHVVREVLRRRLRANHLYAKVEECAFSVNMPRFRFGPDGLQMDTSKIQVIRDRPTPEPFE